MKPRQQRSHRPAPSTRQRRGATPHAPAPNQQPLDAQRCERGAEEQHVHQPIDRIHLCPRSANPWREQADEGDRAAGSGRCRADRELGRHDRAERLRLPIGRAMLTASAQSAFVHASTIIDRSHPQCHRQSRTPAQAPRRRSPTECRDRDRGPASRAQESASSSQSPNACDLGAACASRMFLDRVQPPAHDGSTPHVHRVIRAAQRRIDMTATFIVPSTRACDASALAPPARRVQALPLRQTNHMLDRWYTRTRQLRLRLRGIVEQPAYATIRARSTAGRERGEPRQRRVCARLPHRPPEFAFVRRCDA